MNMKQLKPNRLILTAVTSLLLTGAHARTWTSADGGRTFEGDLQSYDAASGNVTVTLPNGRRMTFTQDKLSADDIAWLKKNGGRSGGGAPPRSANCQTNCPIRMVKRRI
jgi:hypothetical protein